jgi:hypothetical protein
LSYAAPVLWNAAMIGTPVSMGIRNCRGLPSCWRGDGCGSALQFAIQIPVVLRVAPITVFDPCFRARANGVRNFIPAFVPGSGAIEAYIDIWLASFPDRRHHRAHQCSIAVHATRESF